MDRAERRRQLAVLSLGAIGFVTSLYLVALHERLAAGDLSPSVCAVSAEIDCAPALLSRYASVGGVPVAAYGAWFYALVIVVACLGSVTTSRGRAGPRLIVLLGATLVGSLVSVALALLSLFVVGALCPLCTLLYAVNLALFAVAWIDVARRPGGFAAAWASSRAAVTGRPAQTLVFLQPSKGGSVSARTVRSIGSPAPIAIMLALLLFVSISAAAGQRSDPATRPPEPAGAQDRPGRRHPAFHEHRRPSRTPAPDKTDAPVPPNGAGAAPRPSP